MVVTQILSLNGSVLGTLLHPGLIEQLQAPNFLKFVL